MIEIFTCVECDRDSVWLDVENKCFSCTSLSPDEARRQYEIEQKRTNPMRYARANGAFVMAAQTYDIEANTELALIGFLATFHPEMTHEERRAVVRATKEESK